jgi:hypothetical protein
MLSPFTFHFSPGSRVTFPLDAIIDRNDRIEEWIWQAFRSP